MQCTFVQTCWYVQVDFWRTNTWKCEHQTIETISCFGKSSQCSAWLWGKIRVIVLDDGFMILKTSAFGNIGVRIVFFLFDLVWPAENESYRRDLSKKLSSHGSNVSLGPVRALESTCYIFEFVFGRIWQGPGFRWIASWDGLIGSFLEGPCTGPFMRTLKKAPQKTGGTHWVRRANITYFGPNIFTPKVNILSEIGKLELCRTCSGELLGP